jgi:hypothetical protein
MNSHTPGRQAQGVRNMSAFLKLEHHPAEGQIDTLGLAQLACLDLFVPQGKLRVYPVRFGRGGHA